MGCPRGCSRLQGKRRINHSIPYAIPLLPPGKATKHPGSTCRALAAPPQDIGVIWGDAQPSLSTPLTRRHRERRERTREGRRGRPHHQALPVAASATGEGKRKGDSFGKAKHRQGWLGSDTCGLQPQLQLARVAARGHGCCHRIDHGFVPLGRSCPQRNAAGEGLAGLVWKPNRLIKAPLLVLACREGRCMRAVGQE